MAGDGRAHGDLGGLAVSDFADGVDIRVLAQDGAQAAGKGHADLFIDLDLVHPVDVVFHRVFQRHKVHVALVQLVDHAVHGGRLTASGGTHHEDNAVAAAEKLPDVCDLVLGQADFVQAHHRAALVQQTRDDLLAVDGGEGRDTQVEASVFDADVEAAVLGDAALGDVQARHDLQTGQHRALQVSRHGQDVPHHAVDAHADQKLGLMRLEVNVAGALGDGALDDAVDQADGRGAGGAVLAKLVDREGVAGLRPSLAAAHALAAHLLNRPGRALVAVEDLDAALDGGLGGDHRDHLPPDGFPDLFNGVEVQRVVHGEVELVLHRLDRHDLILPRDVLRKHLGQLRGNVDLGQVDILDAELHLQRLDQFVLRDDLIFDQHVAETVLRPLLQIQSAVQFLLGDGSRRDQQFTQSHVRHNFAPSRLSSHGVLVRHRLHFVTISLLYNRSGPLTRVFRAFFPFGREAPRPAAAKAKALSQKSKINLWEYRKLFGAPI